MEVSAGGSVVGGVGRNGPVRVKKKTLRAVLEQCQRALELLETSGGEDDEAEVREEEEDEEEEEEEEEETDRFDGARSGADGSSSPGREADELCDLLKSRVECPDFLEKLEGVHHSVPQHILEEGGSWDMVSKNDLWEGGNVDSDKEDYVLVCQEDIVEGIACFMAAYLLSFKETKELTPNQLQEALSKTFAIKKKKGKLRKAWDGSKVIYNVASWGATAIGIYQNPALIRAASDAFWASCRVISKLL